MGWSWICSVQQSSCAKAHILLKGIRLTIFIYSFALQHIYYHHIMLVSQALLQEDITWTKINMEQLLKPIYSNAIIP